VLPKDIGFFAELFTTSCDWKISTLGWMYTLFFVFLGCSAATWGGWLERAGPRKAGVVSAVCWCGGMLISALGIHLHQFWLMILGSGVIGGIGLGLGYISPGLHADQVVPRPPRHGHRHGHHGLRRRRDDRLAAGRRPDEASPRPPRVA
jgi:MFS family permease